MPLLIELPEVEIRAKASSSFTVETIDRRLAVLREHLAYFPAEQAAREEIEYLTSLRIRKFGR